MLFWKQAVKHDTQLATSLTIDKKLCRIILSNKTVFGPMSLFSAKPKYNATFFNVKVSNKNVGFGHFYSQRSGKWKMYGKVFCFGGRAPGYFAYEVKKMKYLSQFLMTYSAWLAKKNK